MTDDSLNEVKFTVPEPAQAGVRQADAELGAALRQLGALEADYLREKQRLLRALDDQMLKRKQLLDGAARALGLDIDTQRWDFDFEKMTFTLHRPN